MKIYALMLSECENVALLGAYSSVEKLKREKERWEHAHEGGLDAVFVLEVEIDAPWDRHDYPGIDVD